MIWAVRAAQSGNHIEAACYLEFPPEVVTDDITSKYFLHPWLVEDCINEYLITKMRSGDHIKRGRIMNCRSFNAVAAIFNALKAVQNELSGLQQGKINILDELIRIGNKQFEWQRGFTNNALFYRTSYIFGGGRCSSYFEEKNGLSFDEFTMFGFGLWTHFVSNPIIRAPVNAREIGLSDEKSKLASRILCKSIGELKNEAKLLKATCWFGEYGPSVLRKYPCISLGNDESGQFHAPIPELVAHRVTHGMYYDVITGGRVVREEIGERFESYCLELLRASVPQARYFGASKYFRTRAQQVETPDIRVKADSNVLLVIECKANRLNVDSKFNPEKLSSPDGMDALVKGVTQLWYYFRDVRLGRIPGDQVSPEALGMILTLDPWLQMANTRYDTILKSAREAVEETSGDFIDDDFRAVAFCEVSDFESLVRKCDLDSLVGTIRIATRKERAGWLLASIHSELYPAARTGPFVFESNMPNVVRWWNRFDCVEPKTTHAERTD